LTQQRTVSEPGEFIPLTLLCSHLDISALYKFHVFQTQHQMTRLVHLFMQQRGKASPKPSPANSAAEPSDILTSYPSKEHPASRTPFKIPRFPYNDNVHHHKQSLLNKEIRKQDIMKVSCSPYENCLQEKQFLNTQTPYQASHVGETCLMEILIRNCTIS
jgi:hypothetical protein